jgi:hypothetical protein
LTIAREIRTASRAASKAPMTATNPVMTHPVTILPDVVNRFR